MKQKVRVYYRGENESDCPFCGELGFENVFVESDICGGYMGHSFCLERVRMWQATTKTLVNVLAPDQDPKKLLDLRKYQIVSVIDKVGAYKERKNEERT